jgi:hypothetical protein
VNQDTEKGLHGKIREKAASITDQAGRPAQTLMDRDVLAISAEYGMSVHDVYKEMLRKGIYPYRYLRNRDAISKEEQLKLAESRIAVVGVGGLGRGGTCIRKPYMMEGIGVAVRRELVKVTNDIPQN